MADVEAIRSAMAEIPLQLQQERIEDVVQTSLQLIFKVLLKHATTIDRHEGSIQYLTYTCENQKANLNRSIQEVATKFKAAVATKSEEGQLYDEEAVQPETAGRRNTRKAAGTQKATGKEAAQSASASDQFAADESAAQTKEKIEKGWAVATDAAANSSARRLTDASVDVMYEGTRTARDLHKHRQFMHNLYADVQATDNSPANSSLLEAARSGFLPRVRYLVTSGGADSEATNKNGTKPVHFASFSGHLDIVRYLLMEASSDVEGQDQDGNTPLAIASWSGHSDIAQYLLLEARADIEAINNDGLHALHLASQQGHLEMVKLLIWASSDAEARDIGETTPLVYASACGHLGVVNYMLTEAGANIKAINKVGEGPLHAASSLGHLEVLKYLVTKANADIKAVNCVGDNPLYLASWNGHLELVKYLVSEASSDVEATNNDGMTPLLTASRQGHFDIVRYLLTKARAGICAVCAQGGTCLHWAAQQGHLELVHYLCSDAGADVLAAAKGASPRFWASMSHRKFVKEIESTQDQDISKIQKAERLKEIAAYLKTKETGPFQHRR